MGWSSGDQPSLSKNHLRNPCVPLKPIHREANKKDSCMPYFINPVEEEKCVFLTHEGEMSMAEAAAAREEAGELLTAKQWNRIIVDITAVRSLLKGLELFKLGEAISETLPPCARIALVVRADQTKGARLIEQVARNSGAFLTFFTDVRKAEAWVRGDPLSSHRPFFRLSQREVTQEQNQEPRTAMMGGNQNA